MGVCQGRDGTRGAKEPGTGDQEVNKVSDGGVPDLGNNRMSESRSEGWLDNGHCLQYRGIY